MQDIRMGLGCMRLSDVDEHVAAATISAAFDAGITTFDTAHAYGAALGDNEGVVARTLRGSRARVLTKGGMKRPDGAWVPDGRAKTILSDCEASLEALDGVAVDLWLLHAPDPRTPWRTSMRALARLVDDGLVPRVGVCNVNRRQLDEALDLAPISAVQCALSVYDDEALRGGVVERCEDADLTFFAHSPLGGPRKRRRLLRDETLDSIAAPHGATAAQVALGWLLSLSRVVVPVVGPRAPERAKSAAEAADLRLTDAEYHTLKLKYGEVRPTRGVASRSDREVVVIMGVPGAGKSRLVERFLSERFVRLNRDERGGSLRDITDALDAELSRAAAPASVVLDNTYLTRASRSRVLDITHRHGFAARCIWLDTPLEQAQINLIERILDRTGSLPSPEELKALARSPGMLTPTSLMRTVRELEPPSVDEGWSSVERVEFVRSERAQAQRGAVFVAARADPHLADAPRDVPHLVFHWDPDGSDEALLRTVEVVRTVASGPVEGALCAHPGGPPKCWCRPPLPGLILEFARRHGVDPARSTVVGTSPAHKTLARALGARFVGAY